MEEKSKKQIDTIVIWLLLAGATLGTGHVKIHLQHLREVQKSSQKEK